MLLLNSSKNADLKEKNIHFIKTCLYRNTNKYALAVDEYNVPREAKI